MTKDNDDLSDSEDELSPDYDANPIGKNQRLEPRFSNFDEDDEDEYEEPDRDTDYTSGYRADNVEEEDEFEDDFPDEEEDDLFPAEDSDLPYEADHSVAEEPDVWLAKEGYLEEDEVSGQKWPLGLIAVAIVALVLLTAGGYGVVQQRAATQEELRQLRATLATSANTGDMGASREALQNLQQSYDKLSANAEALTLENRRLADTVAGLEAQLGVQQAVLTKTVPAANPVKPQAADAIASLYGTKPLPSANQVKPATAAETTSSPPTSSQPAEPEPVVSRPSTAPAQTTPEPSATPSAAAASAGPWFVNFGSYTSRNMAETWASKLLPDAGKVIVVPNARDGQTLYRVRVVGLADRGSAQEVARQLEAQLRVSALWIGKE